MTNKSNALWIGAIVIVAALTAVELLSTRDDESNESVDTAITTGSAFTPPAPAPASPQQDTGQISMGTTTEAVEIEHAPTVTDIRESVARPEPAPNLIIDLDNPEADIAAFTENLQYETEIQKTKELIADRSTEENPAEQPVQSDQLETAATIPAQSIENEPADMQPLSDTNAEESIAQPTTETALTTEAQHSVSQHLADAELALKELRMTTPVGNNAYEHYQAALTIDPENTEAQAGIQKIVDMYIYFVEKAIAEDQLSTARVYLQRAENLQSGSPKLKSLRAELD